MAEAQCSGNSAVGAFDRSALSGGGDPALGRLLLWLEAVQLHTGGCNDLPANKVGRWSQRDIETFLRDVKQLVIFLERTQEARSEAGGRLQRDQLVFVIYNRRFTLDELQRTFYGGETLRPNAMLTRGAVLHADIADFIPGNHGGDPLAEDGGRKGWRPGTMHWEVGRRLIDLVAPSPGDEADAVLWYQAVSAYLLREGRLAEVSSHLARARGVFPEQPVFLLDSGYLHQELSSSAIQAAVQDIRAGGAPVAVRSRRAELQSAERFLRRALAFAPDDAEARLRLGRTLGELGRHEEAAAELRKSIDGGRDRRTLYLGELFLGREEQALGRGEEAKRHFENAAALGPNAQSALLALGHLARQAGDRAGALRAIRSAEALASSDGGADPWWSYYEPHKQDADELMTRMRNIGSSRVR